MAGVLDDGPRGGDVIAFLSLMCASSRAGLSCFSRFCLGLLRRRGQRMWWRLSVLLFGSFEDLVDFLRFVTL